MNNDTLNALLNSQQNAQQHIAPYLGLAVAWHVLIALCAVASVACFGELNNT